MTDDSPLDHPPRPKLVFRVGVVGHRWDKMGLPVAQRGGADATAATAELEQRLQSTAERVLKEIARIAGEIAARKDGYAGDAATLVVISGLAEGSDRIVATAGMAAGFQLWAVLPFERERYLEDFDERWQATKWSRPGAVREFDELLSRATQTLVMDGAPGQYDAYVPLGRATVHHSDLLIGIWDAEKAAGAGGTANILSDARQAEVPIVRIDPNEPDVAWLEERREPDHGRSAGLGELERRLRALLEPPTGKDLREPFFGERFVRGWWGKSYGVMQAYVAAMGPIGRIFMPTFPAWLKVLAKVPEPMFRTEWVAATKQQWEENWSQEDPVDAALRERLIERLAPLHAWADNLATYYSNRHRSAFTLIWSLAWVAAVVAVLGFVALVTRHDDIAKWGTGVELVVVGVIFSLARWGQSFRFHEKWIDYRTLAERVRHLTFVWPAGASTTFARMDDHPSADDPRATWVGWLYRATVRQLGFAAERVTPAHIESCRRLLREHEMADQIDYHDRNAEKLGRTYHTIHTRTNWMFGFAVFVSLLHLVAHHQVAEALERSGVTFYEFWAAGGLTVLSVFFPSRAAALHGWAGHADFFGAALRSAQVETRLEELARVVDAVQELDSGLIGDFAVETSRAMESELLAWHAVSRSKPLQHV